MDEHHDAASRDVRRPIDSLISKSEKAQRRLTPGTWQHTMLRDNLKALRIAVVLMDDPAGDASGFAVDDLRDAVRALTSMMSRTEQAQRAFVSGTSQHTLLTNRLAALRVAESLVADALQRRA